MGEFFFRPFFSNVCGSEMPLEKSRSVVQRLIGRYFSVSESGVFVSPSGLCVAYSAQEIFAACVFKRCDLHLEIFSAVQFNKKRCLPSALSA